MPLIFYIDDSRDDLFYLEYTRRKGGFEAELFCFAEAQSAWDALEERDARGEPLPDLVIADLYMPLDGGLELIRKMSGDDRFSAIVTGICSGSEAEEDRARALETGAVLYLAKPLNMRHIQLNLAL